MTTRRLRQLNSRRERLVSEWSRLKNRIQSVLAGLLVVVPVRTLFSQAGQQWLAACGLPEEERTLIESDLRLIAAVDQELDRLETNVRQEAWRTSRVRLLITVPGVDSGTGPDALRRPGDPSRF